MIRLTQALILFINNLPEQVVRAGVHSWKSEFHVIKLSPQVTDRKDELQLGQVRAKTRRPIHHPNKQTEKRHTDLGNNACSSFPLEEKSPCLHN